MAVDTIYTEGIVFVQLQSSYVYITNTRDEIADFMEPFDLKPGFSCTIQSKQH